MSVYLVAGKVEPSFLKEFIKDHYAIKENHFIGIDRGTLLLVKEGIRPVFGVGDFDSITPSEKQMLVDEKIVLKTLPTEKDDTDTQQALLEAIQAYPKEKYILLGTTGGRVDHFFANLYLPLEERFLPYLSQIHLQDSQNYISFYQPGKYRVAKRKEMNYLGYVALTAIENLTLKKSKYLLTDYTSNTPVAFPSNEFIGQSAEFSFTKGFVVVIQSKD